jgi:hypothetical protein
MAFRSEAPGSPWNRRQSARLEGGVPGLACSILFEGPAVLSRGRPAPAVRNTALRVDQSEAEPRQTPLPRPGGARTSWDIPWLSSINPGGPTAILTPSSISAAHSCPTLSLPPHPAERANV